MDVVAAGNESSWTYAPLRAEIHGNRLYGRWCYRYEEWLGGNGDCHDRTSKSQENHLTEQSNYYATVGEEVGELGGEQLTKAGLCG